MLHEAIYSRSRSSICAHSRVRPSTICVHSHESIYDLFTLPCVRYTPHVSRELGMLHEAIYSLAVGEDNVRDAIKRASGLKHARFLS